MRLTTNLLLLVVLVLGTGSVEAGITPVEQPEKARRGSTVAPVLKPLPRVSVREQEWDRRIRLRMERIRRNQGCYRELGCKERGP